MNELTRTQNLVHLQIRCCAKYGKLRPQKGQAISQAASITILHATAAPSRACASLPSAMWPWPGLLFPSTGDDYLRSGLDDITRRRGFQSRDPSRGSDAVPKDFPDVPKSLASAGCGYFASLRHGTDYCSGATVYLVHLLSLNHDYLCSRASI